MRCGVSKGVRWTYQSFNLSVLSLLVCWLIGVGNWIYGVVDLLAASDVSIFLFKVSSLLASGTLTMAPLLGLTTTPGAGVVVQVGWVILVWVALGGMA